MAKMLKYTVNFWVDESWVADGFDLTDERAKDMLNGDLQYAYGHELHARVVSAPKPELVARIQGYEGERIKAGAAEILARRQSERLTLRG